jgi:hypothetical protein
MKSVFLAVTLFLATLFGSHTPATTPPAVTTAAVANSQPSVPQALAVTSTALPPSTDAAPVFFASNSNATTALTDPQIAANGNGVYYAEISAPVTQLSNITVSNVSGLIASEIPALNYFPAMLGKPTQPTLCVGQDSASNFN